MLVLLLLVSLLSLPSASLSVYTLPCGALMYTPMWAYTSPTGAAQEEFIPTTTFLDLNGDALPDVICSFSIATTTAQYFVAVLRNAGTGWQVEWCSSTMPGHPCPSISTTDPAATLEQFQIRTAAIADLILTIHNSETHLATRRSNTTARDVLTVEQAAEYLQAAEEEVLHLIEEGSLRARMFKQGWRISKTALNEILNPKASV